MFSNKKHHRSICFFENEGGGAESVKDSTLESVVPVPKELIKPQLQQNQELLDAKRSTFLDAQKKTIALGNALEAAAMSKVEAAMQTKLFDAIKDEKAREDEIKKLVNEFMTSYKGEHDALRENLEKMNPPLSVAEIENQLQEQESFDFEQFINRKIKEQNIEKRKESRKQRYLKVLVATGDEEKDKKNQELVAKFDADYPAIKSKILEEHPELQNDKEKLSLKIQKSIDERFIEYCDKNGIEIDGILLLQDEGKSDIPSEVQISEDYVRIEARGSILQAQNQYLAATQELASTAQAYQQESSRYERAPSNDFPDQVVYNLPKSVIDLPPGNTVSFTGSSGSGEIIYEAYREPDGQFTLKFNGHTIKDLPKKEMEVVVDINAIPVVNTIFTASSELYRTLLREYSQVCLSEGSDPLQNPPLGFIDFLYIRLNDAYIATSPDNNDASLLGLNISDMPTKERGKYIRNVLMTNTAIRDEVIKKLEKQKILVNGKINLSRYPR